MDLRGLARRLMSGRFQTTSWSLVLTARAGDDEGREALARLCEAYWPPLHAYVRSRVRSEEEARDLTQAFFERLLSRGWLERVRPEGGRLRAWFLTAIRGFLANEHDRATAAKRGGGQVILSLDWVRADALFGASLAVSGQEPPDRAWDRRWAATVLERAMVRLREEAAAAGRLDLFDGLSVFLSREAIPGEYGELAPVLGRGAGALAAAVHRLRERYREAIRREVSETVSSPDQTEPEMAVLIAALRDGD